jgi:type II secretory pathway pseudopilin PulG
MAALLVAMAIMAVMMSVALPVWRTLGQREKEEELIFRGRQYARAITLYQRKFGAAYPPSIDALVAGRFLRKKYKDPITSGDFLPLTGSLAQAPGGSQRGMDAPGPAGRQGAGGPSPVGAGSAPAPGRQGPAGVSQGLVGVVSKSTEQSIRIYNGRSHYNEWAFVAQAVTQQPTAPGGGQQPGTAPPRPGPPRPAPSTTPSSGQRPMFPGSTGRQ